MSWARIDDQIAFHEKTIAAGNEAFGVWVRMLAWSCAHLTDGRVPESVALLLAEGKKALLSKLVGVGFLDADEDAYLVHDFHDWNPTATEVQDNRKARSEAGRRGGLKSGQARSKQTPSKVEANASALAEANPQANAKQNPTPSPSPSFSEESIPDSAVPKSGLGELVLIQSDPYQPDLEAIYRLYPRKEGRKKGLARLKAIVRTPERYALVMKSLANYRRKIEIEGCFVKHFDSWVSVWEDYVNYIPTPPRAVANGPPQQSRPRPKDIDVAKLRGS